MTLTTLLHLLLLCACVHCCASHVSGASESVDATASQAAVALLASLPDDALPAVASSLVRLLVTLQDQTGTDTVSASEWRAALLPLVRALASSSDEHVATEWKTAVASALRVQNVGVDGAIVEKEALERALRNTSSAATPAAVQQPHALLVAATLARSRTTAARTVLSTPEAPHARLVTVTQLERDALVSLYWATNGPGWARRDHWLNDSVGVCDWFGIVCTETTGDGTAHVAKLELPRNGLQGTVPPELGRLANLTHVNLHKNALTSTMPAALSGWKRLQWLNIGFNQIVTLPSFFTDLPVLEEVVMQRNRCSGTLPASWSTISSLKVLRIMKNFISGTYVRLCHPRPQWSRWCLCCVSPCHSVPSA